MHKDLILIALQMVLAIKDESSTGKFPGSPISPLQLDLTLETGDRLHIKITDPNKDRWEIPEKYKILL